MKLMTKVEFEHGGRPSPEALREWRSNPVTERFFNNVYFLSATSTDANNRNGFHDCQLAVLDLMNDVERELAQPKPPAAPPEPDYGSEDYLKRRAEQLNA